MVILVSTLPFLKRFTVNLSQKYKFNIEIHLLQNELLYVTIVKFYNYSA